MTCLVARNVLRAFPPCPRLLVHPKATQKDGKRWKMRLRLHTTTKTVRYVVVMETTVCGKRGKIDIPAHTGSLLSSRRPRRLERKYCMQVETVVSSLKERSLWLT